MTENKNINFEFPSAIENMILDYALSKNHERVLRDIHWMNYMSFDSWRVGYPTARAMLHEVNRLNTLRRRVSFEPVRVYFEAHRNFGQNKYFY